MTEGNHENNHNPFDQHRNFNSEFSEYETSVMNFDRRYALCIQNFDRRCALRIQNFITDHTSQSAGAGMRASNFNRCSDATVRTLEVPLVHEPWDDITLSLHPINDLLSVGRVGNLHCGRSQFFFLEICLYVLFFSFVQYYHL